MDINNSQLRTVPLRGILQRLFLSATLTVCALSVTAQTVSSPTNEAPPKEGQRLYQDLHGVMGHRRYGEAPRGIGGPYTNGTKIWGFDVSHWQGVIDFNALRSNTDFLVIRASFGCPDPGQHYWDYADSKLSANRSGAESNGIECGFYHYSYPQINGPIDEANCFCDNIGSLQVGQFVALDYEEPWNGDAGAWCRAWLDQVQARLGVKPFLYVNLSTANSHDWSQVINAGYPIWLARWDYDRNADPPATPWPYVALRQYSNQEHVSGISGNVDGDVFYGDLNGLRAFGLPGGTAPSISFTSVPESKWFSSNEHFVYHAVGSDPLVCHEIIDSTEVASYATHDGYVNLSAGGSGWHDLSAKATNGNGSAETSHAYAGYDVSAPGVSLTDGTIAHWYNAKESGKAVGFWLDEAENNSGVRHMRYKWDSGDYSDWIENPHDYNSNHHRDGFGGSAAIPVGKHTLTVQAEDDCWSGTNHTGNAAELTLGEFWADYAKPTMSAMTFDPGSPGSPSLVHVHVTASDDVSGINWIKVLVDGESVGVIHSSSGVVDWPTAGYAPGSHQIDCFAFDNAGNRSSTLKKTYILNSAIVKLVSLSVKPSLVKGGKSATGTVTLSAPAGAAGFRVDLASSDLKAAVPTYVRLKSGSQKATFAIVTRVVLAKKVVTITGQHGNTSKRTTLTLTP